MLLGVPCDKAMPSRVTAQAVALNLALKRYCSTPLSATDRFALQTALPWRALWRVMHHMPANSLHWLGSSLFLSQLFFVSLGTLLFSFLTLFSFSRNSSLFFYWLFFVFPATLLCFSFLVYFSCNSSLFLSQLFVSFLTLFCFSCNSSLFLSWLLFVFLLTLLYFSLDSSLFFPQLLFVSLATLVCFSRTSRLFLSVALVCFSR